MNYIEAVKELVNNPKAIAITFPTSKGIIRRIELREKAFRGESSTYLVFPATETRREQTVIVHSPEFLLREDFTVVYRKNIYDEISDMVNVDRAAVKKVFHAASYIAEEHRKEKAFQEFKAAMKTIFGD